MKESQQVDFLIHILKGSCLLEDASQIVLQSPFPLAMLHATTLTVEDSSILVSLVDARLSSEYDE